MKEPAGRRLQGAAGLCGRCEHAETVVSARGSTFHLCRLSQFDPRFSKYPALPVIACEGYVPVRSVDADGVLLE